MRVSSFTYLGCRFLYDGSRINDDDTPASLEMEDNGMLFLFFPCERRLMNG